MSSGLGEEVASSIVVLDIEASDMSENSNTLKGFETGRDESDSTCPLL